MEDDRFDALVMTLASGVSRRRVVRTLGGGLAGALAAALGRGTAEADSPQRKCKQASRPCSFDTHCCSGLCCNHRCCAPGDVCNGNGECEPVPTSPPPPPPPPPPPGGCTSSNDCPPAPNECQATTCVNGQCGFANLDLGTQTCGTGACQRTVARCANGQPQACTPGAPTAEVCNGIDDDCDGVVDNGAACPDGGTCVDGSCQPPPPPPPPPPPLCSPEGTPCDNICCGQPTVFCCSCAGLCLTQDACDLCQGI